LEQDDLTVQGLEPVNQIDKEDERLASAWPSITGISYIECKKLSFLVWRRWLQDGALIRAERE
jgi:hypothetical protein